MSDKSHVLFSANYKSFVNIHAKLFTGLAIVAFAIFALTYIIFTMQVVECNKLCNLEDALCRRNPLGCYVKYGDIKIDVPYWLAIPVVAFIGAIGITFLQAAARARMSTPFYVELTTSGIHIVKGVKARERVFIPWEAITKIELRTSELKWRRKMEAFIFSEFGFTAVDIYTAKGDVEEIYIRSKYLQNLVETLKKLSIEVTKS